MLSKHRPVLSAVQIRTALKASAPKQAPLVVLAVRYAPRWLSWRLFKLANDPDYRQELLMDTALVATWLLFCRFVMPWAIR